jgi:hypothetical protein
VSYVLSAVAITFTKEGVARQCGNKGIGEGQRASVNRQSLQSISEARVVVSLVKARLPSSRSHVPKEALESPLRFVIFTTIGLIPSSASIDTKQW